MKLEKLRVSGNAFLNIPDSVVKKGQKAVTKYFDEFRQETRNCCKIKLMVVGQENVGKSIHLFFLWERNRRGRERKRDECYEFVFVLVFVFFFFLFMLFI